MASNTADRLAAPFVGALVALVVIRRTSTATWGGLVEAMVVIQLAAHLAGWGNKEFLVREFSQSPARIAESWQTSLITRLALFALLLPSALLVHSLPPSTVALGALWCLATVGCQSAEVLVLYRKDFLFAVAVEVIGGLVVLALASRPDQPPTVERLVGWFALATGLKCAALLARYWRLVLTRRAGRFDLAYFQRALPFFLLGLTGLLQSRADLYAVTWLLPPGQLGGYQILITMLLLLQAGAYFVLLPFTRALYRMKHAAIVRISRRLLGLGIAVVAPALGVVQLVLERLYRVPVDPLVLLLGAAMVLPVFYYSPAIYELFKLRRQAAVVRVNLLGTVVSFGLSVLLLPHVGLPGALIAAAAAQCLMLCCYVLLARSASRLAPALSRLS